MRSFCMPRLATVLGTCCLIQLLHVDRAGAAPAAAGAQAEESQQTAPAQASAATRAGEPAAHEAQAESWLSWKATRRVLSRFAPALSLYYARRLTDPDAFEFNHQLGFLFACDFEVTRSLFLSTELALYQVFDEPDERFVASNWLFGVTHTFELPYVGTLYPQFYFKLPTNPDDRDYLSYRGSVGLEVELKKPALYTPRKNHVFGAALGLATQRDIYQYTANEAGYLNRTWQLSAYGSANYKYRDWLMLLFKIGNNWNWYPEGKRANDRYVMSLSLHGQPIKQVWLALAWYNADRTYLYDQMTSNVNFYSPQSTSLIFYLTYMPRIPKTHELNN